MHACLEGLDIEDKYVAGLWKGDLCRGLLWRVPSQNEGAEIADDKPKPYVAPTWSWTSRNGPVEFRSLPDSNGHMCKMEDCEMDTIFDSYGPVKGGKITIKAYYLSHFASFSDKKLKEIMQRAGSHRHGKDMSRGKVQGERQGEGDKDVSTDEGEGDIFGQEK